MSRSKGKNTEMEARIDQRGLEQDDHGNAQHKLGVLGLMTDQQHTEKHRHRAARRRDQKQRALGDPQTDAIQLGKQFIIDADHDGKDRDHTQIKQ